MAKMTISDFKNSLSNEYPLKEYSIFLKILWYDYNNNWQKAHELAQEDEGNLLYDRLHAYLHRKEGDDFNAKYWYRLIKKPYPTITLTQEWEILVAEYLDL
jgi:hypothetical protein